MELEGGHRNSVIKQRNSIEFGLIGFVLKSTLILYGNQGLMMELEVWQPTSYVRNIKDSSEKNYGMSVAIASHMTEPCIAHVMASPQHSSCAAPMSRRNRPPRHPSAV
ncbi:hypothetical protein EVAR_11929_1 [Eumeta japonica]|uniref:Uncharacterized protein n=1 Tax=Eumeta variegata TaxID=151549 RepID=A0A4C1U4T6_EUMVA|nr:hypothetical protein EVAR_11929_1 [Eumeta japonica]